MSRIDKQKARAGLAILGIVGATVGTFVAMPKIVNAISSRFGRKDEEEDGTSVDYEDDFEPEEDVAESAAEEVPAEEPAEEPAAAEPAEEPAAAEPTEEPAAVEPMPRYTLKLLP